MGGGVACGQVAWIRAELSAGLGIGRFMSELEWLSMRNFVKFLQIDIPWHVVQTKPRAKAPALENHERQHLKRQDFEVFLPKFTLQKVRRLDMSIDCLR